MDWLGDNRSASLNEEVLGLGSYGKTLAMLSSSSLGAVEGGYDEDEKKSAILSRNTHPGSVVNVVVTR